MNVTCDIVNAKTLTLEGRRGFELKYGENPQQKATFYSFETGNPFAMEAYIELENKDRGAINTTDIASMGRAKLRIGAMCEVHLGFVPPTAVGAKHNDLCGAGIGRTPEEAITQMLLGDPISIFGGSVMVNFHLTAEHATLLRTYGMPEGKKRPLDVICAPSQDEECDRILRRLDDKSRVFLNPAIEKAGLEAFNKFQELPDLIPVPGGMIAQEPMPLHLLNELEIEKIGSYPKEQQFEDLLLGIAICATATSNTIVAVRGGKLIGSGVCQKDRVGAAQLCIALAKRAGHGYRKRFNGKVYPLLGAVVVSDSFFPFVDGPRTLINAGASFIFATSGSKRDDEVAELCRQREVTLWRAKDTEARMFARHRS